MTKARVATVSLLVLLVASAAARAQVAGTLVQASLLADVSVVKPGEPFTVGVMLEIKPGWHVYWLNPGDAGLPTRVEWALPAGYTASALRFPVPEHVDQPGGIVIYGYRDQVLLTSVITPPSNLSSTDSTAVPISAKVNWLCCSEDCVPGKATVHLELSAGEKSMPDHVQLFDSWRKRLPEIDPAPASALVLSDVSPHCQIVTRHKVIDPKSIIPGAVDGLLLTVGTPSASTIGTSFSLSAQVLKGQTVTATSVPILITWADQDGKSRLGEQINIPIVSGR